MKDKEAQKIAMGMFQLVYLVDDKEIEQRWDHLQPSVRRQWSDKAESLIEVFESLSYRKLPDKESMRVKLIQMTYGSVSVPDFVEWIYEEVSDNIC